MNQLPLDGVHVLVTAEKASSPARLARFDIEIEVPQTLEERHREGVLRSAKKCLIHNTLVHGAEVQTTLATTGPKSLVA